MALPRSLPLQPWVSVFEKPNISCSFPGLDIRKLLEDYVTYLASRTEYSNEVRRMDNHRSSLSATLEKRSQYSSENRFETPLPPQWQSEVNKFSRYETIHDPVPPPTPTPANDTSEAAKVTLSVRDEELNKLIDRIFVDDPVVKSNDTVVSESREINTTTMLPSTELGESSTTPMPTTAVSTEATTRSIAPEDNSTVSTYSRSQLFSNIDEVSIVNSSKIDSERYYTGENDFMEANSTVPPLRLLLSESNVLNITAEDDNTNSNNFNTKLNELDDTELLRELKRTKELLQAQIDKLKSMQTVTLRANSEEIVDVGRMIETVTGVINATTIARPSSTTPGPVINQADLMKSPITQNVTDLQPQQPTTTVPPPPSTSTLVEIETTTAATTTTSASELETTTIIPEISESEIVTTETVWNPELTETTTLAAPPTEVTTTNFEIQTTTESVEAQFSSTIKPINGTLAGGDGLNLSNEPITVVDINLKHPGAINSLNVTQSEVGVGVEKKRDVNETDSETMILTHVPKITIIHKIHKPVVSNRSSIEEMEAYKDALRKHKELIKSTMSSIALYPAAFKQYKFNQNNKVNSVGEIYLWPNFSSLKSPHYMEVGEDNGFLTTVMPVIGPQQTMVPTLPSLMLPPTSLQSPLPPKTDPLEPKIIDEPKKRKVPKFAYKHAMNKFNRLTNDLRQTTPDHEDHDHKPPPPGNATNVANSIRIPSIPPKPYHQNYFYQLPNPQNPENILKFYRPRYRKKYKRVRIPLGYRLKKNVDSGDKPQGLFRTSPIALTIDQNNRTFERKAVSQQVVSPTPLDNDNSNSFKIFCAYDAHRSLSSAANVSVDDGGGGGQYFDINLLEQYSSVLEQCTHLVYAFASVDLTGQLATVVGGNGRDEQSRTIADPYHSNLIRIQRLKLKLPRLKILAAVGGFDTPPQLFSLMVATAKLREKLAENIFQFVLKYDFDGIIIAWFYPVFGSKSEAVRFSRSTSSAHLDDRQNLVKFIRVLRKNLDSIEAKHLEIGVLSPPFEELIDRGYDVAKLSRFVESKGVTTNFIFPFLQSCGSHDSNDLRLLWTVGGECSPFCATVSHTKSITNRKGSQTEHCTYGRFVLIDND